MLLANVAEVVVVMLPGPCFAVIPEFPDALMPGEMPRPSPEAAELFQTFDFKAFEC